MAKSGAAAASNPPESGTVLPAQFWSESSPGAHPERRLMAAVLEDAIALGARAASSTDPEIVKEVESAGKWLASDDRSAPFAFASICDVLGLDAESVREAIAKFRLGTASFVRPRDSSGHGRHQIREKRTRRAA